MKKVRFKTPENASHLRMNDSECHSPRPFMERQLWKSPSEPTFDYAKVVSYSTDPLQRYENSNCSPYPMVNRTAIHSFPEKELCWKPSDDLNLSLLDASSHEPRKPVFCRSVLEMNEKKTIGMASQENSSDERLRPALSSIDNNKLSDPPNVLVKDNSFFIRRDNLDKFHINGNPIQLNSLGKENNPLSRKIEMMKSGAFTLPPKRTGTPKVHIEPLVTAPSMSPNNECNCHHCAKIVNNMPYCPTANTQRHLHNNAPDNVRNHCQYSVPQPKICSHCEHQPPTVQQNICKNCPCHSTDNIAMKPINAVDKKTWAIEKFEESKQPQAECMEVEKQSNVSKEKREPTVADLFKIIKLQNEQLQLLQEKVDKFISCSRQNLQPTISCSTEHVEVNTLESDQHKLSVGVMTSFEFIRTSTVINKEVLKQKENAQIQCNKSQISIKEVVSKPVNLNFLEGIMPVNNAPPEVEGNVATNVRQKENICEEKTLNELSLYNVQVDNATTPLMSPDQTLYLDVRDYSDSEAGSDDQSNVGWTYYNKVMTHVNGMLQDSEMPSSASAMYRNTRQQCVQMQIDKTNVSVTKRVKFGDDPRGLHQPHIYTAPSTDTSLKMNQLAAKYLQNAPTQVVLQKSASKENPAPIDMSFATRNYMERHKILKCLPASKSPQPGEIPRFLDITALKQQPKFL